MAKQLSDELSSDPPAKVRVECGSCGGTGKAIVETCPKCGNRFLFHVPGMFVARNLETKQVRSGDFLEKSCKCGWKWRKEVEYRKGSAW